MLMGFFEDKWLQGKTLAFGPTMSAGLVLFVEGTVAKIGIPVLVVVTSLTLHR